MTGTEWARGGHAAEIGDGHAIGHAGTRFRVPAGQRLADGHAGHAGAIAAGHGTPAPLEGVPACPPCRAKRTGRTR